MADLSRQTSELTTLLHENQTYHAILKALCEKEGQGFNELFQETSNLRLQLHPEMGELSKGTYYDCINSLLNIDAVSREKDPQHSQRWLYKLEPSLKENLKRLYDDVEATGHYMSVESAELYLRGLGPSQAANYVVEYSVKNLIDAYCYCAEKPVFAEYRLSLTLNSLHVLGVSLAKLGDEPGARGEYLEALAELRRRIWVEVKVG